jgi:hypothetical protein
VGATFGRLFPFLFKTQLNSLSVSLFFCARGGGLSLPLSLSLSLSLDSSRRTRAALNICVYICIAAAKRAEEFCNEGVEAFFGPEEGYFFDIFLNSRKDASADVRACALCCAFFLFCALCFESTHRSSARSDGGFGKTQKHTLLF